MQQGSVMSASIIPVSLASLKSQESSYVRTSTPKSIRPSQRYLYRREAAGLGRYILASPYSVMIRER